MKLTDITPAIFVKNLRRRPDRLEHITNQMAKIDTPFTLYHSADNKGTLRDGNWWATQNFLQIIRYAKEVELPSVMQLDDDCLFVDNFNERLTELWPHIPQDWDYVSFGEVFDASTPVYPGIAKTHRSWGGHASLIRNTIYDRLLERIKGVTWADEEVNLYLKSEINFYMFTPYLITQVSGHSDLKDKYVDNGFFI